jgi:aryl-alcohol dehydrogenase-like predicted oxidoreductase
MRNLGLFPVAPIGFGCMNLSHAYGAPPPEDEGERMLLRALDLGATHFDTAALYGFGRNEELVGRALAPHRARITLASKCGMTGVDRKRVIDGRPETLERTCEESLRRLRTDVIDLYYLHRWDKRIPIEESVGALANLVRAGKIRAIGLSEVSAATLRRAHAVHPITAVQSEYSLSTRNPELGALDACRDLGAACVAFSPLSRGLLAGGARGPFAAGDIRSAMPRFNPPHHAANLALADAFARLAAGAGCTPAQLALAWLLDKAPHVVPIPGTTSPAHLEENMAASAVRLAPDLCARIEALINANTAQGPRYPDATQAEIDTEEFA